MGIFAGLRTGTRTRGEAGGARELGRRVARTKPLRGPDHWAAVEAELRDVLGLCLADPAVGPDHEVTAQARSRLARVLVATGDHAQARSEAEAVLAAGLGAGPVPAAARLEAREAMAAALNAQGQHALAATYAEQVAKELADTRGARHPLTLAARSSLAQCWLQSEGYEAEAEAECRSLLSVSGRQDPTSQLIAGAAGNGLAYALNLQGRHAEAESAAREALRAAKKASAVPGVGRVTTLLDVALATALSGQGRHQEALTLLDAVRLSAQRASGPWQADAGALELARTTALLGLGRHDEAGAEARRALDAMSPALGPEHRRVARAHALLADIATASRPSDLGE